MLSSSLQQELWANLYTIHCRSLWSEAELSCFGQRRDGSFDRNEQEKILPVCKHCQGNRAK